jgi:hypothetical protein
MAVQLLLILKIFKALADLQRKKSEMLAVFLFPGTSSSSGTLSHSQ